MAGRRPRLILFARFPIPGRVKTRLIPALGAEGAAAVHRRLVLRSLRTARAFCTAHDIDLEVRFAAGDQERMRQWLGDDWACRPQCDGDLGQRMAEAFAASFREGSPATILIGSDCPGLTPAIFAAASEALKTNPVVFGPATDGGYYLVGMTRLVPELFQDVAWGTATVLAESLEILKRAGQTHALLEQLDDVDRPEDLSAWRHLAGSEDADLSRVSVIIPALNEAANLAASLASARAGSPQEILVIDGGSSDGTGPIALGAGATVIQSRAGRARQMNAGAARATGNVLLFLHADTLLPEGWVQLVPQALRQPGVVAGSFRFRVAESFPGRWFVEWTTNLRSQWFQSPYGDQGQFLRRALFEELGGFADLPILEDYELNQRLRQRGRIATARAAVVTSGRRWKRLGLVRTSAINRIITVGYRMGIRPDKLARLYRRGPA